MLDANNEEIKLTGYSKTSGCAAKIPPDILAQVLDKLPKFHDDRLLVGIETSDDAAVYKVTDDIAMIQTLDFFTPIVDDPYTFGQIAATNALSDVWAMGGEPAVALNIVGFPNYLDPEVLGEILRGGSDKVKEAGAVLVGGHTIQNAEPQYGLSVSGFVHPDKIFKNFGCKVGDVLILTKQIGVGLVNTAIKAGVASEGATKEAITVMTSLNKKAKSVAEKYNISACTDVTGFGLLGHMSEMATASDVSFDVTVSDVPHIKEAVEYAKMGLVPAGTYKNKRFRVENIDIGETKPEYIDLLFDPQTSGGLLLSVNEADLAQILQDFDEVGMTTTVAVVGRVKPKSDKAIYLINE
jgi:selenide,water dikinase